MIKIIILLILVFSTTINSMIKNACFQNEKKVCTGVYDSTNLKYTENCNKLKCKAPLAFDCKDYCTNTILKCKGIILLKAYKSYNGTFQNCSVSRPKLNDFCLNGKNCLLLATYNGLNKTSTIDCKCPNDKSFICGEYCAKNSMICNAINISEAKIYHPESCDNHQSIYYLKRITTKFLIRF